MRGKIGRKKLERKREEERERERERERKREREDEREWREKERGRFRVYWVVVNWTHHAFSDLLIHSYFHYSSPTLSLV